MASARVERRLAAILAADVVGYSRLIERDERGILERLRTHRKGLVEPLLAQHRGRVVKLMGDGALCEFASVVDAVACAIAIQRGMAERGTEVPEEERLRFRIGTNLGDVVREPDGDLHGDGVHIAARLEGIAEPGGIVISGTAYDHLQGKINRAIEFLGERQVKNIARAVRVYRARLDREAGPRGWTARLDREAGPERPALTLPDRPSIAVLPFANMSRDPDQDYFADGVVEETITALSRISWPFVSARNSSFTYRGRAVDARQVGRGLGVRYVLEGSVRRAGDRLRITGQLIDASTCAHPWADRFDGRLEDICDLQDRVAESVVAAIAPKVERAEPDRARRKPTDSQDAYDLYLRGLAAAHLWAREGNAEALGLFRRATDLDPDFAAAYGMGARCHSQRKGSGWVTDRPAQVAETERLARRALALGRDDAVALAGAGIALAFVAGDPGTGAACIERALQLNPSFARGWLSSAWTRTWAGEHEVALDHVARAMRLSPSDPNMFTMRSAAAVAHLLAGRSEEALVWAEEAAWERPGFIIPTAVLAAAAAFLDRQADAEQAIALLRTTAPDPRLGNPRDYWPVRRPDDIARWTEGLRRAGLPP